MDGGAGYFTSPPLYNLQLFSLQLFNDDHRLDLLVLISLCHGTDWLTHLRSYCPRLAWSAWASKAGDINANILHMANIFTLSALLIQLHSPLYSAVVGPSIIIGISPTKGHRGTGAEWGTVHRIVAQDCTKFIGHREVTGEAPGLRQRTHVDGDGHST